MEAVERGCRAVRCEASAPGKLILMGEHSAVYGRPAVIAAVGMFTRATVSPADAGELEIDLPDLEYRERHAWKDVTAYGDRRRESWDRGQGIAKVPGTGELGSSTGDADGDGDGDGVARVAVAEAIRSLEPSRKGRLPAIRLSVSSELPVGSGFGSSASVAVAVSAALLGSLSKAKLVPDDPRIAVASFETEKRQHGRPSGVDHTAVIRGGLLAVTRKDDSLRVSELARPDWFRKAIRIYDTGAPGETTGQVVAAVRKLGDRQPSRFAEILDEMEGCTQGFMEALLTKEPSWSRLVDTMLRFEACLEELEVVPSSVAEVVRLIESAGGAAKVSGAGSLSGSSAGSLIVLWPPEAGSEKQLEAILGSNSGSYRRIDAELGARGLELRRP